jgi:hypothetical protein
LQKNKDKIDHFLTGSDLKLTIPSATMPSEDIGEEPNSKFIDYLHIYLNALPLY